MTAPLEDQAGYQLIAAHLAAALEALADLHAVLQIGSGPRITAQNLLIGAGYRPGERAIGGREVKGLVRR